MVYQVLADVTVLVHLAWIAFLVFGAIPGRRWRWVRWTHLAAIAFSIALQSFTWICPLTSLEVWLRGLTGTERAYQGSFIGHYAGKLVYAPLPPGLVFAGTLVVTCVSLWVYFAPRRAGR